MQHMLEVQFECEVLKLLLHRVWCVFGNSLAPIACLHITAKGFHMRHDQTMLNSRIDFRPLHPERFPHSSPKSPRLQTSGGHPRIWIHYLHIGAQWLA